MVLTGLPQKNEEAFLQLYAKEFANDRLLHIVLVSLGFQPYNSYANDFASHNTQNI